MQATEITNDTVTLQFTEQDRALLMLYGLQYCFDKGIQVFGSKSVFELAQEIVAANEEAK